MRDQRSTRLLRFASLALVATACACSDDSGHTDAAVADMSVTLTDDLGHDLATPDDLADGSTSPRDGSEAPDGAIGPMLPFKLYDDIFGYRYEPADALVRNGFAGTSSAGVFGVCWLPVGDTAGMPAMTQDLTTDPTFACNSVSQNASAWIAQAVQTECTSASATVPSLMTWDLEWDTTVALNRTNMQQIAKWVHAQIHATTGACVGKPVRSGFYGNLPTTSYLASYAKSQNGAQDASYQAWLARNNTFAPLMTPYVDYLAPTLYPYYAPDNDSSFSVDHVAVWHLAAIDVLTFGSGLKDPQGHVIPMIPFLGMRYYDNTATQYHLKFVEPEFFTQSNGMLPTLMAAASCEGAVYWDWGLFGSAYPAASTNPPPYGDPAYGNDGSDVWSTSWPWLAATYDFFATPFNTYRQPGGCSFTGYPGSEVLNGATGSGWTTDVVPSGVGDSCWAATTSGYTYMEKFRCTSGAFTNASLSVLPPEPTCVVGKLPATCAFGNATLNGATGTALGYSSSTVAAGTYCPSVRELVTCNDGTLSPAGAQAVCYAHPQITSFTPQHGPVGTVVTITGNGFSFLVEGQIAGGTSVAITVVDDETATMKIAAGATSGVISIQNIHYGAQSATSFTVTQ